MLYPFAPASKKEAATMTQTALPLDSSSPAPKKSAPGEPSSLDHRFAIFHSENPKVYEELCALARQAKSRGRKKIGMKMLFEVVRWNRFIETNDPEFKLNNNHHSRYARLLMKQEPDLAGFFDLRELRS